MASLDEIRQERIKKLNLLKDNGINPYPISSKQNFTLFEVLDNFSKLSKQKKAIKLVGRVMALRGQGALVFCDFSDGTETFQALLKKGEVKEKKFQLFKDTIDIGDFVELKGNLFVTKRKEKSLLVSDWSILSKSLRPLPDKWHGLQDVEERFRRRYLDTLMSEDVRNRFITKSKIITAIRDFLDKDNFLEVETPLLQPLAGGASALPFLTHHNSLDIDLYLRIAPELYLKKLLIGGFPRVYEIGRNFRNEGIDATHNPEFTMLEFYESYSDAKHQMVRVEKLLKTVAKKILNKTSFVYNENKIDFSKKFKVVSYFDLLQRYALITNPGSITKDEALLKAKQLGVDVDKNDSLEKIIDSIYKKVCRPKLIQPTFIIDYQANCLPLAKRKEDDPEIVDAFQLVIGGMEFVKAFSELNDPLDQAERFEKQKIYKKEGDSEAQAGDEEFLEAMEYGMPPAGGVGIGIDRLAMILTDAQNIKEVILFPTMRPKE